MAIATAILMGLLIERLILRPLLGEPVLAVVMVTIALATVLGGLATLLWGAEYKAYHGLLPTINLKVGAISVPSESLIGLIVSVICVAILMLLFRYTKIGLAMRATAEDLQVVQSVGIKATTVYAVSWVIASVVGVIGGILLGGVSGANMELANIGLKAFAVVLLGGVNSVGGAIVGGIILGMLENVAAGYLDPLLPGGATGPGIPLYRYDHRAHLQAARAVRPGQDREGLTHGLSAQEPFTKTTRRIWPSSTRRLQWGAVMCLPHLFSSPARSFCSDRMLTILTMMGISVISVHGLNILTGYCGQISIGHAGFMAVGGYTSAILCAKLGLPFWAALPCGALAAGIAGSDLRPPVLEDQGLLPHHGDHRRPFHHHLDHHPAPQHHRRH